MTYKFICKKCGQKFSIDMPLKSYTPNGHICENCGSKLERDVQDYAGGTIWRCSGYYGVGNH